MDDEPGGSDPWEPDRYDSDHGFVAAYGESVLDRLDPGPGERILDLGCGTGELTAEIRARGADVVGLDASESMIERARDRHPACDFVLGDARSFTEMDRFEATDEFQAMDEFDAVFSNAVLHWIPRQDHDAVLAGIAAVLVDGGRFVAEFGGTGKVQTIETAPRAELASRGYDVESPWYFPSIGAYAPRLERAGFEVRDASLFDRPTTLDGGLASWLRMFGDSFFADLDDDEIDDVIDAVEDRVREDLFVDDDWVADYRRLRFVAVVD
jgi:trans-aconitate methyltransferase